MILPLDFITELNILTSKLITELAIEHGLNPTRENILEIGKLVAGVGISFAITSNGSTTEEIKEYLNSFTDKLVREHSKLSASSKIEEAIEKFEADTKKTSN